MTSKPKMLDLAIAFLKTTPGHAASLTAIGRAVGVKPRSRGRLCAQLLATGDVERADGDRLKWSPPLLARMIEADPATGDRLTRLAAETRRIADDLTALSAAFAEARRGVLMLAPIEPDNLTGRN